MENSSNFPNISLIIPTLNAQKTLLTCLKSISKQDYPKSKIEIIISDGGSKDKTILIAKKYKAKIIPNPLITAEAGKAVGLKAATGEYLIFIDSDNILPTKNWLHQMIAPLIKDSDLIGSEPIKFTYRTQAGFIERYSALIGANDPYAFISGVYDRFSFLSNKWTGLKLEEENYNNYLKIELKPNTPIPTIGANGTVFRKSFFTKQNIFNKLDYFFDIDIINYYLNKTNKSVYFAKIKNGIIHTYCESSISKFIRKQERRITDYYAYQQYRQFNWKQINNNTILKFTIYNLTIIPPIFDSIKGFLKKPDIAWFFHPLACYITFFIYAKNSIKSKMGIISAYNRNNWQQ